MVAAVVVVGAAAAVVAVVPNVLDRLHGLWLLAVHGFDQLRVHGLAVAYPRGFNLKGFVEEVVLRGDDVHEVADASRRVSRAVQMNVNAAGVVGEAARLAELADKLLQGFNVLLVGEDGADQLDAVGSARAPLVSVFLLLGADAAVAHELPNPPVRCGDLLCVVVGSALRVGSVQVLGGDLRGLLSGDPRELDLDPESCGQHGVYLRCFLVLYLSL